MSKKTNQKAVNNKQQNEPKVQAQKQENKPENKVENKNVGTRKVGITDTTIRDGQQSLIATRMSTDEFLPILEKMDKIGYHSIESWGGATFDSCIRFLKEDPWERLRKIRAVCKNTKLQMLLRGQNILGYRPYADDVVEYFVQKSVSNGIDIIRVFDALNDMRNLQTAVTATIKEGGHAQVCICYTLSDVHTLEYNVNMAKRIEEMGASSICIKDMAGLLLPSTAYELVTEIKKTVKIPVQIHTHYTAGTGSMSYLKAIEAGADVVDCALSPFALGTSQPATEVMVASLKGTEFDTGLDLDALSELTTFFRPIREKAIASGLLDTKVLAVDVNALRYQVPGGMLSNLVSQLKQQKAEDKYYEVLEEVPRCRADLGYPPLVTPTSQIVGTQAVLNVIGGERYKMTSKETKDIVRGMYGKTPVDISQDIVKKIIGNDKRITCRPADLVQPELKKLETEMAQYKEQDEDVLTYALFPQVSEDFFKHRQAQKLNADHALADKENGVYPV